MPDDKNNTEDFGDKCLARMKAVHKSYTMAASDRLAQAAQHQAKAECYEAAALTLGLAIGTLRKEREQQEARSGEAAAGGHQLSAAVRPVAGSEPVTQSSDLRTPMFLQKPGDK